MADKVYDSDCPAWDFPKDSIVEGNRGQLKDKRGTVIINEPERAQVRFDNGQTKGVQYKSLDIVEKGPETYDELGFSREYSSNFHSYKGLAGMTKIWPHYYHFLTRSYGYVHPKEYAVFNLPFIQQGKKAAIVDVVLHEIAHVLAGLSHQHDPVWKAMAKKIGANPSPCKDIMEAGFNMEMGSKAVKTEFIFICKKCGWTGQRATCPDCGELTYGYKINKLGEEAFQEKADLSKTKMDQIVADFSKIKKFLDENDMNYLNYMFAEVRRMIDTLTEYYDTKHLWRRGTVEQVMGEIKKGYTKARKEMDKYSSAEPVIGLVDSSMTTITGKNPANRKPQIRFKPIQIDSKYLFVCYECGAGEAGYGRRPKDHPKCSECDAKLSGVHGIRNSEWMINDSFPLPKEYIKDMERIVDLYNKWQIDNRSTIQFNYTKSFDNIKRLYNSNIAKRPIFWYEIIDNVSRHTSIAPALFDKRIDESVLINVTREEMKWASDRITEIVKDFNSKR